MALFESRKAEKATEEKTQRTRPTRRVLDSAEDMRRRARHRLIGACLLVLTAIVVFPLLFDTEPRPLPVKATVSVLGRDSAPNMNVPTQVAINNHGLAAGEEVVDTTPAPSTGGTGVPITQTQLPHSTVAPVTPVAPVISQKPATTREPAATQRPAQEPTSLAAQRAQEVRAQQAAAARPATPAVSNAPPPVAATPPSVKPAEPKPVPAPVAAPAAVVPPPPVARPPVSTVESKNAEAARARALLEGRPVESTPAASRSDEGRFIVQVGAFSDEAKVREIKQKLESVGLKTYTQVVQTSTGRATRVRVGPFANRAEADRAADRVKAANLPAAIMSM